MNVKPINKSRRWRIYEITKIEIKQSIKRFKIWKVMKSGIFLKADEQRFFSKFFSKMLPLSVSFLFTYLKAVDKSFNCNWNHLIWVWIELGIFTWSWTPLGSVGPYPAPDRPGPVRHQLGIVRPRFLDGPGPARDRPGPACRTFGPPSFSFSFGPPCVISS